MKPIMIAISMILTILLSANINENYRHGWVIKGSIEVTDLKDSKCRVKKPNEELVLYLEEITDFLTPRRIKSELDGNGNFRFEVDTRYADYKLLVHKKSGGYLTYSKVLYAYNAPETYKLTISCANDMKNWNDS